VTATRWASGEEGLVISAADATIPDVEKGELNGYALRNGQWVTEPGHNWHDAGPERPLTDEHPAINLTWNDATGVRSFLTSLGRGGLGFFVPTEDEWEYACLGGAPAGGENGQPVKDASVFDVLRPVPVRSRLANPWGLFDMLGNLLEWCRFVTPKNEDLTMAPMRGGKFNDKAYRIRPAARVVELKKSPLGGVRLARVAVSKPTGASRVFGK
jgi:formylglycine-generating enzyme required for sulfatase activity